MRTTKSAGMRLLSVAMLVLALAPWQAQAQELSEKATRTFMDYAWSLVPQQFSKQDGTVIVIDKKKKDEVMVPIDVAQKVIKVGRLSAHAQVCSLGDDQILNHRSLMKRMEEEKKWTDQQLVFINQLHLTTVMLLTGKIKVVEKDGDKEAVVEESKSNNQTCTDEQRAKVKELIAAYVMAGPNFKIPAQRIDPATAGAPTATGSTAVAAPAAAAGTKAPAAGAKAPVAPAPKQ